MTNHLNTMTPEEAAEHIGALCGMQITKYWGPLKPLVLNVVKAQRKAAMERCLEVVDKFEKELILPFKYTTHGNGKHYAYQEIGGSIQYLINSDK